MSGSMYRLDTSKMILCSSRFEDSSTVCTINYTLDRRPYRALGQLPGLARLTSIDSISPNPLGRLISSHYPLSHSRYPPLTTLDPLDLGFDGC